MLGPSSRRTFFSLSRFCACVRASVCACGCLCWCGNLCWWRNFASPNHTHTQTHRHTWVECKLLVYYVNGPFLSMRNDFGWQYARRRWWVRAILTIQIIIVARRLHWDSPFRKCNARMHYLTFDNEKLLFLKFFFLLANDVEMVLRLSNFTERHMVVFTSSF